MLGEGIRLERAALTAAATAPEHPPRDWFYTPEPPGLMPLTITDDGRVFGHLAPKDACHQGFADSCVTPPLSQTNYAVFHVGEVETAEGDHVAVGKLMYGGNKNGKHAPLHLSRMEASQHYDDNSHVGAYVRATQGQHGIWLSGALRPGIDQAGVAELKANPPSGDWRPHERSLELIAALAVPVPGYPIPRADVAMIASAEGAHVEALILTGGEVLPHESIVAGLVASGVLSQSEAQGIEVEKASFPWAASGRALSLGRDEGVTKLLFEPGTRRLLGAGIVGPNAGELIAETVHALELGADAEDLSLTVHPHPTLSETIGFAAEMAEGTITDLMPPRRR